MFIHIRDKSGFCSFEDLRQIAERDKHPLAAALVAIAYGLRYVTSKYIALPKELAKDCVPWLRNI